MPWQKRELLRVIRMMNSCLNKLTRSEAVAIINRITDRKMTTEILEKLTCPFSDVSETHWAYNDILLAACEY